MNFINKIKDKIKKQSASISTRLLTGLAKTRGSFTSALNDLFSSQKRLDQEFYDNLEELLISSDVGIETTTFLIDKLHKEANTHKIRDPIQLKKLLFTEIQNILEQSNAELITAQEGLTVYLFVGVNGVGKTTTIGKLAAQLTAAGQKVVLAAGDTFRAGSIDQLVVWAERANADIIKHTPGADPAAVIYDGLQAAKARQADILICDSAGRLHNKVNLMNELDKIRRVIGREVHDAPHEVFLVVDATTGQNAFIQAKEFENTANLSGLILTKLDGTAKGGIIIKICHQLKIPVKLLGFGEGIDDLQPFVAEEFVEALLGYKKEEEV